MWYNKININPISYNNGIKTFNMDRDVGGVFYWKFVA